MDGDLSSQVPLRLGKAVRPIGDATHDRLSLLRALPALQRSSLASFVDEITALLLSCELLGCLVNPFPSTTAVA